MQRFLTYMVVLLMASALFALAPVGDAMATSTPTASSLFGGGPDAATQWLENTVQGSNAPSGGSETFLSTYGIFNNNAGGSIQAGLQMVLSWYSYGMLVIGSFLLLYYLVRIIAETAHTGRPGGRANQLWAPIRTVLAIGLLVPLSTGLNSGQFIVVNLASEGSQLASNTWAQFVSAMAGSIATGVNGALSAPASAALETQAVYSFFLTQVCMNAANKILAQTPMGEVESLFGLASSYYEVVPNTKTMSPSGEIVMYGDEWNEAVCGQMSFETPVALTPTTGTGGSTLNTNLSTAAFGLSNSITTAINNAWDTDVAGATTAPVNNFVDAVLAGKAVPLASTQATLATIVQNYNKALTSSVTGVVAAAAPAINDALTYDATNLGWLSAGSMYMAIARLQSTISEALMYAPSVKAPDMSQLYSATQGTPAAVPDAKPNMNMMTASVTYHAPFEDKLIGVMGAASNLLTVQGSTPTPFTLASGQVAAASGPEAHTGGLLGLIGSLFDGISNSGVVTPAIASGELPWLGNVIPTGGFPISDLAVLGANLMKMGAALYAVGIASGASFFGFSGGSGLSMVGFMFGTLLFAPGIALAYILPLMPFIHFLFAVFGWLLAFVEAVIEVPIFALAHLDPEGEGVFPQATRSGYMLLLQLILRPLLICIGLIISILLMNGMVDFLNLVFNATVFGVQSSSKVGTFSELIYTVIYAATAYAICNACFKAIDYVPNHALRWIGGQGDMHDSGQHAHGVGSTAMATASVAQSMSQIGQQFAAGVGNAQRALKAGAGGGLAGAMGDGADASQMGTDSAGNKFNLSEGVSRMAGGVTEAGLAGGSVGGAVGDALQALGSATPPPAPPSPPGPGGAMTAGEINALYDAKIDNKPPPKGNV